VLAEHLVHVGHAGDALAGEFWAFPGADVELLQLGPREIGDALLAALGGCGGQDALEVVVVEGDDETVFGSSEIGLGDRAELPGN
jgi:hypothetical protein